MLNMTCIDFVDQLGSNAPTPGGGSASALVGAVGIALGTMVGELTTGKKTYSQHEPELAELIPAAKALTEEMKAAVNKDVTAFEPLAQAYKMPNGTEEEIAARQTAIQDGIVAAAEAPLELAELCVRALRVMERFSIIGSRLAISDAGTGAAMLQAALMGARLNVLINLKSMKDEETKAEMSRRLEDATAYGSALAKEIYDRVEAACRG